ncbi:unnamed protein product [Moneuplotes crassus]|uniref:Uncharacterized protein n=1 Tax=Euplotes crassus TaxID=5936 RepID=A0AAD2D593_EUPCR|nr:unnamed protein product [Moneuplotes crassus]
MPNQCKDDEQEAGSSISGYFEIPGTTASYLLDILVDQDGGLLYFIGNFHIGPSPYTIIYKCDHNLQKLKVVSYNLHGSYISYVIDPNGDFIYVQDKSSHKIFEISTINNLQITRELTLSSSLVTDNSEMQIKEHLYFSMKISSVMQTCRWDRSTTNLDCLSFGADSYTNFAPISNDLLFFGSSEVSADKYYLVNYNFSDPSNFIWKKSIECLGIGCVSKISSSIISQDEDWIFTMILYNSNYIFHKLNITDGAPDNAGFIWNDSGFRMAYSINEFYDFIAIQIYSWSLPNSARLILIDKDNTKIYKEYKVLNSIPHAAGRLVYKGQELIYHAGVYLIATRFLLERSPVANIDQLPEFAQDTPLFSAITTSYQVSETLSNPSISTSTKTLGISTSTTVTITDRTSTVNPSFKTYVALWNTDHAQSVQSNALVPLNFTWACSPAVNYTNIAFSLSQTGGNALPEWVELDSNNLELHLNKTPKLAETKTFYFSLQISFLSEIHEKIFEITVEQCKIANCHLCVLNSPSYCENCEEGHQSSNNKTACTKIPDLKEETEHKAPDIEASEAIVALVALSIVFSTVSSILSLSSINSIFCTINSLQLAILLPLVPDYFSPKVRDFLSGTDFTMLSFDFIKFKDIPFVETISKWVSYPQSDEYLNSIGMRSGSSVVNYLSLMAIFILLGIIHLGIYLCYLCTKNSQSRKCKMICNKAYKYFTFSIYIRISMQALLFTTLSILSELYGLNLSTTVTKISFGLCAMFGICTSVLFVLSFVMYFKSFPRIDKENYWSLLEYFNGVKLTKFSKLYSTLFMLLRLALCAVLILGRTISSPVKATYFYLINICYGLYLIIVRPLENTQDNIVEVINQTVICCLAIPLSWIDTKEEWTQFYETLYISIFISSSALECLIAFIFLIFSLITYFCKKKGNKKERNIAPKEPTASKRPPQNQRELYDGPSPSISHSPSIICRSNAPIMNDLTTQNRPHERMQSNIIEMRRKFYHRT